MSKVVLAFSGGMDSTVLLHDAVRHFDEVHTISFDYGQRHKRELDCAKKQLDYLVEKRSTPTWQGYKQIITNKVLDVQYIKDIAPVSSLTNLDIANPKIKEMAGDAQPVSYVPFRNLMFLSIMCSYAESVGADRVWYGAALADSLAGYWDGSSEFLESVNTLIKLNRKSKISIEAPLISSSKKEIIELGLEIGVNFANTWTCYSNREDGLADADTPSSSLRLRGFIEAGYKDPIKYVQQEKLEALYTKNNCKDLVT